MKSRKPLKSEWSCFPTPFEYLSHWIKNVVSPAKASCCRAAILLFRFGCQDTTEKRSNKWLAFSRSSLTTKTEQWASARQPRSPSLSLRLLRAGLCFIKCSSTMRGYFWKLSLWSCYPIKSLLVVYCRWIVNIERPACIDEICNRHPINKIGWSLNGIISPNWCLQL